MKKIITTALALFVSAVSFAQVKPNAATTNAALLKCNCADLNVKAYLYKEAGTTSYFVRLDYFNNKTASCTPVLKTLNITRGAANTITVPLSALEKMRSNSGVLIYRVKRDQLRAELVNTVDYAIKYTINYGSIVLKPCPIVSQTVKLEDGEPIL